MRRFWEKQAEYEICHPTIAGLGNHFSECGAWLELHILCVARAIYASFFYDQVVQEPQLR